MELNGTDEENNLIHRMPSVDDGMRYLTVDELNRKCPRGEFLSLGTNGTIRDEQRWLTDPFEDNCLRSFFHKLSAQLRRYEPWEEWFYTTLYALISALALVGNGVVILAVIRKREMRTGRNVLIVNLALSNLMLALTTLPFLWLPSIDFDFPYSNFFCKFANALPGSNIYCSTLTISVMAIDRYYSVRSLNINSPSSQHGQCLRAVLISLLIWFFSFLLSFPLLVYYRVHMLYVFKDVYVYDQSATDSDTTNGTQQVVLRSYGWRQCRLSTEPGGDEQNSPIGSDPWLAVNERMIQLGMATMQALMLYGVPLVVLSIFNMKLTRFLKLNAKQMRQNTVGSGGGRESEGLTGGRADRNNRRESNLSEPKTAHSNGSSATDAYRPSITISGSILPKQSSIGTVGSSSRAAERRRNRTTALLVAMAGSYAVLWFPFTLMSVLIDLDWLGENGSPIVERIDQTCKLLSISSICVNPFLYGFLNTNFRHEFNEIFSHCLAWVPALGKAEQRRRRPNPRRDGGSNSKTRSTPHYSAVVSTQDGVTVSTTIRR